MYSRLIGFYTSLSREDRPERAPLRGLGGVGVGENQAEKEEEGREGLSLVYSASSWRRRLCFFPRLERCVAFLILSVLFREVDTMSILQIRKLRLKKSKSFAESDSSGKW